MGNFLVFVHNFDKLAFHLCFIPILFQAKICSLGENVHRTFPIWEISFDETVLMTLTSVLFLCFQLSLTSFQNYQSIHIERTEHSKVFFPSLRCMNYLPFSMELAMKNTQKFTDFCIIFCFYCWWCFF